MTQKPIVSIVMGAYNRREFLKLAIESAREEIADIPHEILVIDGGSDDGSLEWLMLQKDIITIIQHNRGEFRGKAIMRRSWGYFMNLVFKSAQGKYILMISDDTIFHANAVKNGLAFIEEQEAQGKKVGAVPFYFHDVGYDEPNTYKVFTLMGKVVLNHGIYVKSAMVDIDYADEDSYGFYVSDSDICFKLLKHGYEVLPCKTALMLHKQDHPVSFAMEHNEMWVRDVTAFIQKWDGVFTDSTKGIEQIDFSKQTITGLATAEYAQRFEAALALSATTNDENNPFKGDIDTKLEILEARLNSILGTMRYHVQLTQQLEKQQTEWIRFQQNRFARPFYRRMLSEWALFAPLRWVKQQLVK